MFSYPPALRRTGFLAPKAVRHFGLAAMQARSTKTAQAVRTRQEPPLTPLFLLLAPFALLLAPLLWFAPRPYGARPLATVLGLGGLLLSLGGTDIDIDSPDARVRIKIL